jgi:integrase/recombinase XerD
MLVHPVVVPGSGTRSWTVLGDDDVPVVPVDRFLAYLTDIGRSPNTVKAYAHDMKDLWQFLGFRGLDWREARLEDIGEFVAWLRLPRAGRAGEVAVLPSAVAISASTVNRELAAVSAFYAHQASNVAGPGTCWLRGELAGGAGGSRSCITSARAGPIAGGDLAEGAEEAAADPDGGGNAGDPRCLHPGAGPLLLRPAS